MSNTSSSALVKLINEIHKEVCQMKQDIQDIKIRLDNHFAPTVTYGDLEAVERRVTEDAGSLYVVIYNYIDCSKLIVIFFVSS